MNDSYEAIRLIMLMLAGLMFVVSYFMADKNWFFELLAYFPRKRKGSVKIGGLAFGLGLWTVAAITYCTLEHVNSTTYRIQKWPFRPGWAILTLQDIGESFRSAGLSLY